jgi:hypothetical protein
MRPTPTRALAACTLAVGALMSVAACTGRTGGTAASGSAAAQGSGGSYSDSSAVLSALKNAGHACTPVSGTASPSLSAPGLRSAASCSIGTGGAVTATVFDDHADAQAYASVLTSAQASGMLIGSTSQRAVLGENWVVLVPDDTAYAQQVSTALGASLVGPSSSAG